MFPLRIEAGKRHLVDAAGRPFLVHGDSCWSIVGQLTNGQIDQYLQDRAQKGFTAILFSAPEAYYTNQTPSYANAEGSVPFAPMTDFTHPNEPYWTRVDYLVNRAYALGMACVINPAYLGYQTDGWLTAVNAAKPADLQAYGAWLANRFRQGNVIWSMGGDHDQPVDIQHQWNVMLGIRSVRGNDLVTAHPVSEGTEADDAYTYWNSFAGFSLNWVYYYETNGFFAYDRAAQAYSRAMPFIHGEGKYENSAGATLAMLRRQSYGALLSGACGQFYGNLPIWSFGSPRWSEPYAATWQSALNSPGAIEQTHVKALFSAYAWWKLLPAVGTGLVTSSLGTGAARLYPACADDGSFAMIYVPSSLSVTIQMSALSSGSLRIRLYNPTNGSFTTVSGGPFSNVGTRSIATPGERIIVIDAA